MTAPRTQQTLRSAVFRREREASWRAFDTLVTRAEKEGVHRLESSDLLRLPGLYRAAISALSVARSISLDRALIVYLESLAARGYLVVHGARGGLGGTLADFFARDFPRLVRAARNPIAIAGTCMILGIVAGFLLVSHDPNWYYTLVSDGMAQGRDPMASVEHLRKSLEARPDSVSGNLASFGSFLFSNNTGVGILSFALGFLFGVPTLMLMLYNGMTLGAMASVFHANGLLYDFAAWISIHGVVELTAIVLCGGAGLVVGGAVAFPERRSRKAVLAERGRRAASLTAGTIALFLVAGILESFGRTLIGSSELRYAIGIATAVILAFYFARAGRTAGRGA